MFLILLKYFNYLLIFATMQYITKMSEKQSPIYINIEAWDKSSQRSS